MLLSPEEIKNIYIDHFTEKWNKETAEEIIENVTFEVAPKIARAQLKAVVEWGDKPCFEHSKVEFPAELGGITVNRQKMKKRRCQHCWKELKEGT